MELLAQASTAAEAAAAQAAAAAAALALGQTEASPVGLPDLAQAPLNTVSERGIPCRVGTGLSLMYCKLGMPPLVLLTDIPVSGLCFNHTSKGTSLLLSMLLLSQGIGLSTIETINVWVCSEEGHAAEAGLPGHAGSLKHVGGLQRG